MTYTPINLQEKLDKFSQRWSPRIIARLNDYHLKLAKIEGEFVWHAHPETDEVFYVVSGEMRILFRDGEVRLGAGELYVVPAGVEHKPVAVQECAILLIEPAGTLNTGDADGVDASERAAPNDVWV